METERAVEEMLASERLRGVCDEGLGAVQGSTADLLGRGEPIPDPGSVVLSGEDLALSLFGMGPVGNGTVSPMSSMFPLGVGVEIKQEGDEGDLCYLSDVEILAGWICPIEGCRKDLKRRNELRNHMIPSHGRIFVTDGGKQGSRLVIGHRVPDENERDAAMVAVHCKHRGKQIAKFGFSMRPSDVPLPSPFVVVEDEVTELVGPVQDVGLDIVGKGKGKGKNRAFYEDQGYVVKRVTNSWAPVSEIGREVENDDLPPAKRKAADLRRVVAEEGGQDFRPFVSDRWDKDRGVRVVPSTGAGWRDRSAIKEVNLGEGTSGMGDVTGSAVVPSTSAVTVVGAEVQCSGSQGINACEATVTVGRWRSLTPQEDSFVLDSIRRSRYQWDVSNLLSVLAPQLPEVFLADLKRVIGLIVASCQMLLQASGASLLQNRGLPSDLDPHPINFSRAVASRALEASLLFG